MPLHCGLRIADCGLRIADCGCEMRDAEYRLPLTAYRLPPALILSKGLPFTNQLINDFNDLQ
jgi:hypothetical protein